MKRRTVALAVLALVATVACVFLMGVGCPPDCQTLGTCPDRQIVVPASGQSPVTLILPGDSSMQAGSISAVIGGFGAPTGNASPHLIIVSNERGELLGLAQAEAGESLTVSARSTARAAIAMSPYLAGTSHADRLAFAQWCESDAEFGQLLQEIRSRQAANSDVIDAQISSRAAGVIARGLTRWLPRSAQAQRRIGPYTAGAPWEIGPWIEDSDPPVTFRNPKMVRYGARVRTVPSSAELTAVLDSTAGLITLDGIARFFQGHGYDTSVATRLSLTDGDYAAQLRFRAPISLDPNNPEGTAALENAIQGLEIVVDLVLGLAPQVRQVAERLRILHVQNPARVQALLESLEAIFFLEQVAHDVTDRDAVALIQQLASLCLENPELILDLFANSISNAASVTAFRMGIEGALQKLLLGYAVFDVATSKIPFVFDLLTAKDAYTIGFRVRAGGVFDFTPPTNHAPVANNQSLTVSFNTAKSIVLDATDPDIPTTLTWIIVSSPTHGTLAGSGANRTYTPTTSYSGPDSFTFKVNDGDADSNVATVSITVQTGTTAPLIADIADATITIGQSYTGPTPTLTQGTAPITWSLVQGPSGMTIDANTGVASWPSPTTGSSTVTIRATNSIGYDDESWTLTVQPGAVAPIIADIPNATISAGQSYTGPTPTLTQGTPPITFSLLQGPSGMTINSITGVVSWPSPTTGSPTVTIRAANSAGSDDEPWTLTVQSGVIVSVTAPDATASEPFSNTGTYRLSRTGSTGSGLQVYFAMSGSAGNGSDYTLSSNSPITIPAGQSYVEFLLFPNDDTLVEGHETATLILSSGSGYTIGSAASATITIQDNDPVAHTLTVASQNPDSGISITVSPSDTNGQGNGTTQFVRTYNHAASVTLTAPATTGGNTFSKWLKGGADWDTNRATTIQMAADYTMTAVYGSPPQFRDLIITQIRPGDRSTTPDYLVIVDVDVKNQGTLRTGEFWVDAWFNSASEPTTICGGDQYRLYSDNGGLGPGETTTLQFVANYGSSAGDKKFWAWADSCAPLGPPPPPVWNLVEESDESNNKRMQTVHAGP